MTTICDSVHQCLDIDSGQRKNLIYHIGEKRTADYCNAIIIFRAARFAWFLFQVLGKIKAN